MTLPDDVATALFELEGKTFLMISPLGRKKLDFNDLMFESRNLWETCLDGIETVTNLPERYSFNVLNQCHLAILVISIEFNQEM